MTPEGSLSAVVMSGSAGGGTGENVGFGNWICQQLDGEENFGTAMKTIAVDQMTIR